MNYSDYGRKINPIYWGDNLQVLELYPERTSLLLRDELSDYQLLSLTFGTAVKEQQWVEIVQLEETEGLSDWLMQVEQGIKDLLFLVNI